MVLILNVFASPFLPLPHFCLKGRFSTLILLEKINYLDLQEFLRNKILYLHSYFGIEVVEQVTIIVL